VLKETTKMANIGQTPPGFRLPSGQGPDIGLEDYRGRKHLVVWFTKGMACPFCRTNMSQLARGYDRMKALNAEILQVTPTPPDRAQFYVKNFPIPFPYLCDPEYRVFADWGVAVHSHSPLWYAKMAVAVARMPPPPTSDLGEPPVTLPEKLRLFHDNDMGFFILDRSGVVRYALSGTYMDAQGTRQIPSNDEIVRELERCEREAPTPGRPA
jgi:peroxiredoxin